jgi:Site-specific recombinase XerD
VTKDYSLEALNRFLDYAAEKGLLKRNTAVSRKQASNKILSVLEPDEARDLRTVDVDQAFERFANLQGTAFKPDSLRVYQSRLRSSLSDFFSWVENPAGFKPSGNQRNGASGKRQVKKAERPDTPASGPYSTDARPTPVQSLDAHQQSDGIAIPVPLRAGLTVQILNVPADLTATEAEKLAAIIKAYAMPGS